ncbi:hypothetical protein ThrDRAFT_01916 [Frankia casuarinae]|nr:hypothetical protein ThrDRAFT_01916 [Frankia casuarinae]OAA23846.1 hypothetical protein AAY23_105012 [Frankia casuarinae]
MDVLSVVRFGSFLLVLPLIYGGYLGFCGTRSTTYALLRKVFMRVLFLGWDAPFTIGLITPSPSTAQVCIGYLGGAPVESFRLRGRRRLGSRTGT